MGLAKLHTRALHGTEAPIVIVEIHVANGLPSFSIVGLPDTAVKESRDRVRSAIQMSGFDFPARRITVNLAPADLPKDSGRYDLPIALGILIASNLIKCKRDTHDLEFAGELALDGSLRAIHGALAIACHTYKHNKTFLLPLMNAKEASLLDNNIKIIACSSLLQVAQFLAKEIELPYFHNYEIDNIANDLAIDFRDVKGQLSAKNALEIAASGRHSVLMIGNPGCGKSMLAERMTTILPSLSVTEAIESAAIYSLSNQFDISKFKMIPFRRPHHSSSSVAIVGGGANPKPGEISLAHNGILFLDETTEFDRNVLEVLREPLETKVINISRANKKVQFPANFQLIAAMNPCPCGNRGHLQKVCRCTNEQVDRYKNKISAPLLDRIDLIIAIPQVKLDELYTLPSGESSAKIKDRVKLTRNIQLTRQKKLNYELNNQEVDLYCTFDLTTREMLNQIIEKMGFSARSYYKLLKVARTIADINNTEYITKKDIAQSIQYKMII